ncbi:MAG: energy transducer TonB [Bacteroidota bacterium]
MKQPLIITLLFLSSFSLLGQSREPAINEFVMVEKEPVPVNMDTIITLIGYPSIARDAGIEGLLVARVLVGEQGQYLKHSIITSMHPLFQEPVEKYLPFLKFEPALQGGTPIKFWVNIPFNWRLTVPAPSKRTYAKRVSAFDYFEQGNYQKALELFRRGYNYRTSSLVSLVMQAPCLYQLNQIGYIKVLKEARKQAKKFQKKIPDVLQENRERMEKYYPVLWDMHAETDDAKLKKAIEKLVEVF